MAATSIDTLIKNILSDLRVELLDEFDQNFERQSYFGRAWQRRKSPIGDGSLLQKSGDLRKSIRSPRTSDTGITFSSSLPYAGIHNEGGEIEVTDKMKRFFRAKFYEVQGISTNRKKDGSKRRTLSDGGFYAWTESMKIKNIKAEFYRRMALMKVGQKIKMPERRFIGGGPEVEAIVRSIIDENLNEYLTQYENAKGILSGRQ